MSALSLEISHVVWDWNGTLLDDLDVVIKAVNVGIADFDVGPIDENGYRDHFTRPVRAFYDSLLERTIDDMEWAYLDKTFHDEYFRHVNEAQLTSDAMDAIGVVAHRGWGQSILSMTTQDRLTEIVASHGINGLFLRIDGLTDLTGGLKAGHLKEHLANLNLDPASVMVVGDTPDDVVAARHVGAHAILYDGGSHHLPTLEAMSVPIAHSLVEALDRLP